MAGAFRINVSTSILHDEEGDVVGAVEFFKDLSDIEDLERRLARAAPTGNLVSSNEEMQRIARLLPGDREIGVQRPDPGAERLRQGDHRPKEALHNLSPRRKGPFIKLNCGALPPNLLESELFGYEPGAFTDAKRTKPGQFQMAHERDAFARRDRRDAARDSGEVVPRPLHRRVQSAQFR